MFRTWCLFITERVGMTPLGTVLVHKSIAELLLIIKKECKVASVKDTEVPCTKNLRSSLPQFN